MGSFGRKPVADHESESRTISHRTGWLRDRPGGRVDSSVGAGVNAEKLLAETRFLSWNSSIIMKFKKKKQNPQMNSFSDGKIVHLKQIEIIFCGRKVHESQTNKCILYSHCISLNLCQNSVN